MIIGDEIIKMFRAKPGNDAQVNSDKLETNIPEAGSNLEAESFSIRNIITDNGGRRSKIDRRSFHYSIHLPERRMGEERRIIMDRRTGFERRNEKRSTVDRRESFAA